MLYSLELPPNRPRMSEPVRTALVLMVLVLIALLAIQFASSFADIAMSVAAGEN